MKSGFCEFEDAVAAAIRQDEWTGELRRHVARCEQCANLQLVVQYCAAAAMQPEKDPTPLSTAGFLWWRAQIAERQEQAKRAVAAIELVQKIAIIIAFLLIVVISMLWTPEHWGVLLSAAGLLVCSAAILLSWVRGRI